VDLSKLNHIVEVGRIIVLVHYWMVRTIVHTHEGYITC